MKALLLCLGLCFIITSASVSLINDATTMMKAPILKASPTILTRAGGFHANAIPNTSSEPDLKGISNPAYNISGKWGMIGNSVFQFELDLVQTNNMIRGTMTRTNGNEPVDSIEGTINQGGIVEFNRVRPNQWSQKYTGLVLRSNNGIYTMKGTFTQTGDQGVYGWNATLMQAQNGISVHPFTPKVPSIVSQGQIGKVELPSTGRRILPMVNLTLNKEPSAGVKRNPVAQGIVSSAANLKHLDWRELQRITMSNLGINTTANLEFIDNTSSFIDSSGNDLTARFKWSPTTMTPPASVVWQVSIMPFPYDSKNWANPPGLLAQGTLRSDESEFTLDFSKFIPAQKEVVDRWSMSKSYLVFQKSILVSFKNVAAANLANIDPSNIQAVQANKNFMSWADDAVKQIDAKPAMMMSTSQPAATTKNISGLAAGRRIINPILTTKSISSQVKISPHRSINATLANNNAGIVGSPGSITNYGLAASRGSQSKSAFLSKTALSNALPQDRRTYYVRVVLLDASGNCSGLPSEEKEVIVGKPIVEPSKWAFLRSALTGSSDIRLAIADGSVRPYRMGGEFPCSNNWYLESDAYIDWGQDLNRWCIWRSNLTNLATAEWQISQVPFDNQELMNPIGLVARGNLNLDPADLKSDGCAGVIEDLSSDEYASGHEFSIDFSKFAPVKDPNKPLQIKYYLRVVAMAPSGPGLFTGYSSPTRTINYGQQVQPKIAQAVPVTVFQPDVKVLSYSPIQEQQPEAYYHFIATSYSPPEDVYFPAALGGGLEFSKGEFWQPGYRVYIPPKPEESHWYDSVVDFFKSIVDLLESVVNWVSSAWDEIKGACVNVISSAICVGDTDCANAIGPFVSGGIDIGLASLGIPPELPNADQLTSLGSDYLTKTLIAEAGLPDSLVADYADQFTSDVVGPGVDAFVAKSGSGGPSGLKLDPDYQYRPAYMLVEVNNNQNEPTLPGTLTISEPNHVFKQKPVPIPPLQPGDTLRIPIVFEIVPDTLFEANDQFYESCYYDWNGNPDRGPANNWAICSEDWAKIYKEPETFGAAFSCDPSSINTKDLEEAFKETLVGTPLEGSPLYIKYVYTGNGDDVQITPDQPWSV